MHFLIVAVAQRDWQARCTDGHLPIGDNRSFDQANAPVEEKSMNRFTTARIFLL
jgi:hypothetical protein